MKIPKQEYPAEFKELAAKRVRDSQAVVAVAKELGLVEQSLRNWVKAHAEGKLNAPGTRKIAPEEMELSRLRAENIRRADHGLVPAQACAGYPASLLAGGASTPAIRFKASSPNMA